MNDWLKRHYWLAIFIIIMANGIVMDITSKKFPALPIWSEILILFGTGYVALLLAMAVHRISRYFTRKQGDQDIR